MAEYIKKFETANAADQYEIKDIPFITSIGATGPQNLVCNEEGKKLVAGPSGVVVEDAGPAVITLYIAGSTPGETPESIQYEDGMTWAQWVSSKYNTYRIKANFSKVTDDGAVHMLVNADTYATIDKYSTIDSTINYEWTAYD